MILGIMVRVISMLASNRSHTTLLLVKKNQFLEDNSVLQCNSTTQRLNIMIFWMGGWCRCGMAMMDTIRCISVLGFQRGLLLLLSKKSNDFDLLLHYKQHIRI